MKSVVQILNSKPDQAIHKVAGTTPVSEAAALMASKNIGSLLVGEGDQIAGIMTERDVVRKMAATGRSPKETQVRDIMDPHVHFVHTWHTNEECMALMTERRLRHLPVLDEGKLIGLVSIGDLVKETIADHEFTISKLEQYITGTPG
jgi:CBS domain-containing protein